MRDRNRAPFGAITAAAPCTTCNGNGGKTETTTDGGVIRETWHTCTTCRGTGTR